VTITDRCDIISNCRSPVTNFGEGSGHGM